MDEALRLRGGFDADALGFLVLRGLVPPSWTFVGTMVVVVKEPSMPSGWADSFAVGGSGTASSLDFRLRFLTTWSETVAAFNRGIVEVECAH